MQSSISADQTDRLPSQPPTGWLRAVDRLLLLEGSPHLGHGFSPDEHARAVQIAAFHFSDSTPITDAVIKARDAILAERQAASGPQPAPRKPPQRASHLRPASKPRPDREPLPVTRHVSDEDWIRMNSKKVAHRAYSFCKSYGWSHATREELSSHLRHKLTEMPQEVRNDPDYHNGWINTCLNNAARAYKKKHGKWDDRHLALTPADEIRHTVEHPSEQIDNRLDVARLLDLVTPLQRQILTAHFGLAGEKPVGDHRKLAHIAQIPLARVQVEIDAALATMRGVAGPKAEVI